MVKKLFSIKMRASKWDSIKGENEHISGAEKIISEECIDTTVHNLINRALGHSKGQSDFINISINKVDTEKITYIPCLDISTIYSNTPYDGRQHILELLKQINIDTKKGKFILSILESADNMRGAIILDLLTMKRLEKDKKRGIRVTGIDWHYSLKKNLEQKLNEYELNNNHVKEALALASKVIYPKAILGEICISDDPNYTTGYVTIKDKGYFRITNLKQLGCKKGGRIFLFDSSNGDINECINFFEKSIAIVNTIPNIK